MRLKPALAVAVLGLLVSGAARAETRRLAVLVGNNAGSGLRPALRYAESDAGKLAEVLIELGSFADEDVLVLRGMPLATVTGGLAAIREKVAAVHGRAGKVVLLFYYSGHSDGQSLEIGGERLGFAELRRVLGETGADVRVAIVDSCQSGALLAQKSGRPGPAFEIHFSDEMASSGEAFLTSSAAHETALESAEIRGSFFSHHLVSGLRGAADASGDGRVTLGEAYRYAFEHTLTTTTNTLYGPQHPAYDFRLSGQGEVVLTELQARTASLIVPAGYQRILVEDPRRGQVVAEWSGGGARRLAVPPGPYQLWAFRDGQSFLGRFELPAHTRREVRAEDLQQTWIRRAEGKGGPLALQAEADRGGDRWGLVAGGARRGVARGQGAVAALRLGLRPADDGWTATVDLAAGRGPGFTETAGFLSGGYGWATGAGRLRALLAIEGGLGLVMQTLTDGSSGWTPALTVGPTLSAACQLSRSFALVADVAAPVVGLERDGRKTALVLPVAALGLAASF